MRAPLTRCAALLAALLLCAPAAFAQGNKELMDQLVRQKQKAKDEVFQELQRQGQVPKNGTVTFEATVKETPGKPEARTVRIDSVVVQEAPSGNVQGMSLDPVFAPRTPPASAPATSLRGGAAPAPEQKVSESVTVVNGKPVDGVTPKAAKPKAKAKKRTTPKPTN